MNYWPAESTGLPECHLPGPIDYGVLLSEHARHAPQAPLMLEHLPSEAEYDAARDRVRAVGDTIGVGFE